PRRRPGVEAGAAGTRRDVRLGAVRDPGVRAARVARRRGGARGRGDRDPAEPARADVDAVADEGCFGRPSLALSVPSPEVTAAIDDGWLSVRGHVDLLLRALAFGPTLRGLALLRRLLLALAIVRPAHPRSISSTHLLAPSVLVLVAALRELGAPMPSGVDR